MKLQTTWIGVCRGLAASLVSLLFSFAALAVTSTVHFQTNLPGVYGQPSALRVALPIRKANFRFDGFAHKWRAFRL